MTIRQFVNVINAMTKIYVIYNDNGDFCERIDGVWYGNVPDNLLDMIIDGATIDPAFEENVVVIYTKQNNCLNQEENIMNDKNVNERQAIYDEICKLLTDFENKHSEEITSDEADMYELLCKIQRRWEDTITAQID